MSEQGWREFLGADGVDDWVVLHGGATAVFRVGSLGEAARLAEAVSGVSGVDAGIRSPISARPVPHSETTHALIGPDGTPERAGPTVGAMTDAERSTIFGGEAESYDRYRPGYPPAIIDIVVQDSPDLAVDVGCGTGKAARLVVDRGVDVLGVEPDDRMAAVARRHGIEVVVSSIEEWQPVPCDVMYAAQSWHWVDARRGAEVAAASVVSGGRWVAFWNYEADEAFIAVREAVYGRFAPELVDASVPTKVDHLRLPVTEALVATGAFGGITIDDVDWTDHVSVDDVVQRLASHSSHRLLDAPTSTAIDAALRTELGGPDAMLDLAYGTEVLVAQRR